MSRLAGTRRVWAFAAAASLVAVMATVGAFWDSRRELFVEVAAANERQAVQLATEIAQTLRIARAMVEGLDARLTEATTGEAAMVAVQRTIAEQAPLLNALSIPATIRPIRADEADAAAVTTRWHPLSTRTESGGFVVPVVHPAAANRYGVRAWRADLDHAALVRYLEASRRPDGSAALFRIDADGATTLLARAPHHPAELGRTVRGPLAAAAANAPRGVFDAVTQLDAIRRLVAYSRVEADGVPLVVVNGTSTDAMLAHWRRRLPWAAAALLLVLSMFAIGARWLDRSLRVQIRQRDELAGRERDFRTLADNLPDAVVRFDRQGRHLYANPAAEAVTGLPPQDSIGRTQAELGMPAAHVRAWTDALERVFSRGLNERLEFSNPGPQGLRHWESLIAPEPSPAGGAATALVISRDITERRRAADALRDSEQRLREAQHLALLGNWELDLRSGALRWSDEVFRIFEIERDRFGASYEAFLAAIHPEDRASVDQTYRRSVAERVDYAITHRLLFGDGRIKHVHERGRSFYADDATPLRSLGTVQDVTARVQTEMALRNSEGRFRALVELSSDWYWQTDAEHRFVLREGDVLTRMSLPPTDDYGLRRWEMPGFINMTEADWAAHRAVMDRRDEFRNLLLARRSPDGRVHWAAISGRPYFDAQGAFEGYHGIGRDITQQVIAEQALRASEVSHREMFESNPHPMWVYDIRSLAFVAVNEAAMRQYGYARDEFLRMTIKDIRPPEDVPRLLANVSAVHDGLDDAGTWRHLTKDGRLLEVEITSHTLRFDGRDAELVLAHDVTRRNQAERTLHDREERLRLALQAANQGLYDLDLRTGEAVVSPEYARMLGWEPEAFHETNAAWRQRLHPDDLDAVYQVYEDYVAGRRSDYRVEFRQRTREGGWKWILSVGRIQERDADGQPLRMLGTHTDITAIKNAQAALQDSEARFRVLFDASPVPTLAYERGSLRVLAVNEAFTRLYGYSRDEALALHIPDLYPTELRAAMIELAARVQGHRHVTDIQHLCKDGRRIDVETRSHDYALNGRPGRISVIVDVTEQRRAEAARRAAAERFEKLFHAAPEAIAVSEFESGRFLQVNDAFCELFGHTREVAIGRTSTELQMWTRAQGRKEIVERLRAGRAVRSFEGVARRRSGETIDVMFSAERIELDGRDCLLLMFRDISQRKRLEAALRASEQRFRLAASSGQVWEWDFGAGGVEPASEFFVTLGLGEVSAQERLATFTRVVHPDDLQRMREAMVRHLKHREPYHVQFRATDVNGRVRWFESQGQAVWNAAGRATYIAGTTFEITERHEAEEQVRRLATELEQRVQERTSQLAQSEARYRTIFETVPVSIGEEDWTGVQQLLRALRVQGVQDGPGYFAARPDFVHECLRAVKVRRLNQKALALHGLQRPANDPLDLTTFFPQPADEAQFVAELEAMWAGQQLITAKRSLPSKTGRALNLMMTMSLPRLDDADGTALVCLVDITEIDRLNAELDRSIARLKQANRELETFTYSVSHDLKAPLRGIDGYSRLLLADHGAQLDAEARQFLGHIRQATQQMGALIDDLLAYSRLERRQLALAPLPLARIVEGAVSGLRAEMDSSALELDIRVDPAWRASGDAQGLTMALRNLVDNAIKFSRGRAPPRIAIEAERSGGCVRLTVRDNGVGFDMKFHDRIFSIFQRLHRAEQYPGTGIGLAIVRKAMERMGGRVWAISAPGEGAAFTIELQETLPT